MAARNLLMIRRKKYRDREFFCYFLPTTKGREEFWGGKGYHFSWDSFEISLPLMEKRKLKEKEEKITKGKT